MDCGPGTLRHRYELFEKLGQGMMGRVHRARRRADGVEFVVKQIGLAGFSETSREDILVRHWSSFVSSSSLSSSMRRVG